MGIVSIADNDVSHVTETCQSRGTADAPHPDHGGKTVAQAVEETEGKAGAPIAIKGFRRYALGEGIEKTTGDFAAEVAAAAKG